MNHKYTFGQFADGNNGNAKEKPIKRYSYIIFWNILLNLHVCIYVCIICKLNKDYGDVCMWVWGGKFEAQTFWGWFPKSSTDVFFICNNTRIYVNVLKINKLI